MPIYTLRREQFVPVPLDEVFRFFSDAGNLQELTPSYLDFRILTPRPIEIRRGTLLDYRLKWHGLPIRWQTRILEWNPPRSFVDLQLKGPYKLWRHTHTFRAEEGGTRVGDVVNYELPLGPFGAIAHALMVRKDVESIFDFRREKIARLFSQPEPQERPGLRGKIPG
jgi:ligand-binding SRPBCC domain-containing protein